MDRIKKQISSQYNTTINFFSNNLSKASSRDGFLRYFKNTGWLFIGEILGMIVSFFIGTYVARYLGPASYGLLTYAYSFTGLFSIFASLGINSILSRELVVQPENRNKLLGSGFLIKIIGAFFSIILIITTLFFIKTDWLTSTIILISATSFILQSFWVINTYFNAKVLSKNIVKVQIISLIITSILKLTFVHFNLGLLYFAVISFIDVIITTIGAVIFYRISGLHIKNWQVDKKIVYVLLKDSWPLILSGIASTIYMKIDQIMIKNMIGVESSGLYAVAVKLSTVWYFIPGIISSSLGPAIINAKKISSTLYKKRLINFSLLLIIISILISSFVFIFSGPIIHILFGKAYNGAYDVLKIHIWSLVPIFLSSAIGSYIVIENLLKINLWSTISGAILNIILNIILIPKMGIKGAAIATLISYSFLILFNLIFIKIKKIYINTKKHENIY